MQQEILNRAKACAISNISAEILLSVGEWFNGHEFEIGDQTYQIGQTHEPSLRQLCEAVDRWNDKYEEAYQTLIDRGVFQSDQNGRVYIAGQPCQWQPTMTGFSAMEHIFKNLHDLYPEWATDAETDPPLYRPDGELMPHRKGTCASAHALKTLPAVDEVDYYPQVEGCVRPDLLVYGKEGQLLARVEVITEGTDTVDEIETAETWKQEFAARNDESECPTIWIFDDRTRMTRFCNCLVRDGIIELDGGEFGGRATNWSATRVNDRLLRSREGTADYSSRDACWTITGILRAEAADVQAWAHQYDVV